MDRARSYSHMSITNMRNEATVENKQLSKDLHIISNMRNEAMARNSSPIISNQTNTIKQGNPTEQDIASTHTLHWRCSGPYAHQWR